MSTSASSELENHPSSHLPTKVFEGHTDLVWSVAYFSDGKRIVSVSEDKTIRIWNVESGKQEGESLEQDFQAWCISISPDERTLAVSTQNRGSRENRVVLWNLESRSVVWTTADMVNGHCVAFSPGGQLIAATAENDVVLLDAETGARRREPLQFGEEVTCLAFSPDGTRLAAGSYEGTVRVFDVATNKTILGPINAHPARVTSALFTPDGKQIITASYDKSIRVWDGSTGLEVGDPMQGHEHIYQIALSHDGRRLASASGAAVTRIWDLSSRRRLGDPLRAQGDADPLSVAWSLDGRSVIAGDENGNISLWDVAPLEVENSDTITPPVVTGNPPQPGPSSPRSRTGSLSSSFLDLPAAGPSNQLQSNQPPRHDGFWDTSDIDLPARARPQISSISRAKPSDASPPTLEHAARELHPPASRFEPLVRLWNQRAPVGRWTHRKSREDRDGPHEMQPTQLPPISTPPANVPDMKPPPRLPRTSSFRTAKVSAAHGFSRTHAATADADDKVSRWDYICYCMCCPCKRVDSESDVESDTES